MGADDLVKNLVSFFKAARHLWGRCPHCDSLFRLSDVAISSSPEPPRDWLRSLQRQQAELLEQQDEMEGRESDLIERQRELTLNERDIRHRELNLERDAHNRVRQILRSKTELQAMIRAERKSAVQSSRATLLGKLLERIAPCFRTFSYDPRDMRCISDPYDYVLFDGLTVERHVKQIAFIEVKCGRGNLSGVQRSVRDVVERGRVYTEVWTVGDPDIPITKQLSNGTSRRALPSAR
jgi:predicted Holliday junction resolvase-like endonuclease